MSYTILHTVPTSGAIQTYREFHNSYTWGRLYWEWLAQKYLGLSPVQVMTQSSRIWPLFNDKRLSLDERICLGCTYDWVMVKKQDIPRLVTPFANIGKLSNKPRWNEMSAAVSEVSALDIFAICWTVTSITDAWHIYDPKEEDSRLYDVSIDTEHWFLFDKLEE